MKTQVKVIIILGVAVLAVGFCFLAVPPFIPGAISTPTRTPERPTRTPTLVKPSNTPTALSPKLAATSTFTPAPPLPSPFDMILYFTNGTCGSGTPNYSYTFTIDGTALTLLQTDAGITTTGSYDPFTGAFSTLGDVGPGVETYGGTITFDGATIAVAGSYSWTPDGGATCMADTAGTTTP